MSAMAAPAASRPAKAWTSCAPADWRRRARATGRGPAVACQGAPTRVRRRAASGQRVVLRAPLRLRRPGAPPRRARARPRLPRLRPRSRQGRALPAADYHRRPRRSLPGRPRHALPATGGAGDRPRGAQAALCRAPKTPTWSVSKPAYAHLAVHYATRTLMHEAALAAQLDCDRLSFTSSLRAARAEPPGPSRVFP